MKNCYLVFFLLLSGCVCWCSQPSRKADVHVLRWSCDGGVVCFYLNSVDCGADITGFKSVISKVESLPDNDLLLVCGDKLSRFGIFPYFAYAWEYNRFCYDEDYSKFMSGYYDIGDAIVLNAGWDDPDNSFNNACRKLDVVWVSGLKVGQGQVSVLKWRHCKGNAGFGVEYFLNGVSCGKDGSGFEVVLSKLDKDATVKGIVFVAPEINRPSTGSESLLGILDDWARLYNQKPWDVSKSDASAFENLLLSKSITVIGALNTSILLGAKEE